MFRIGRVVRVFSRCAHIQCGTCSVVLVRLWVPLEPDGDVVLWLPNGTGALQIGYGALPLRMVGMLLGVVGVVGYTLIGRAT